jgi:hypothetical protein
MNTRQAEPCCGCSERTYLPSKMRIVHIDSNTTSVETEADTYTRESGGKVWTSSNGSSFEMIQVKDEFHENRCIFRGLPQVQNKLAAPTPGYEAKVAIAEATAADNLKILDDKVTQFLYELEAALDYKEPQRDVLQGLLFNQE